MIDQTVTPTKTLYLLESAVDHSFWIASYEEILEVTAYWNHTVTFQEVDDQEWVFIAQTLTFFAEVIFTGIAVEVPEDYQDV